MCKYNEFVKLQSHLKLIRERLTTRELLEGLAEEASELSQAALKCIRASKMNNNVTNVDAFSASMAVEEEFCDVLAYMMALGLTKASCENKDTNRKIERWFNRLNEGDIGEDFRKQPYTVEHFKEQT